MAMAAAASSQHLGLALITSLACLRGRAGAITSAASKSCRLELDKLVPQLNAHGALSGFQGSRGYILREPICRPRSLSASATTQESVRGPSQAGPPSTDGGVIDTSPPRGTRDFPPEDMRLRTWLFNNFREVSSLFGFEEIDFPVLESEELYIRKAGEEITQQLYNFEDKGGRRVTLRPELTPSLARLVLQKGKSASLPLKWFAIGQCWRYERMTRGRRREHYQWNMDIIGIPGVEAEAELLSAIVAFFSKLGITSSDVGIKISNRKVLQEVLGRSVIPESSFAAVCVIVDKIEKIPRAEVEKELTALGLPVEAVDTILRALTLRSLDDLEELLGSDNEAVVELKQLFELARGYGFEDWLQFDASVVRGLAYYTGTVFEAFDRTGTLRAICGGGRYDKLLSTFGGVDTPACGFGFGDAVIVKYTQCSSDSTCFNFARSSCVPGSCS